MRFYGLDVRRVLWGEPGERVGARRLRSLVLGLPFESAFARSNGAPLDPSLAVVEAIAAALGARRSTPAPSGSQVASVAHLKAMARDARKGGD